MLRRLVSEEGRAGGRSQVKLQRVALFESSGDVLEEVEDTAAEGDLSVGDFLVERFLHFKDFVLHDGEVDGVDHWMHVEFSAFHFEAPFVLDDVFLVVVLYLRADEHLAAWPHLDALLDVSQFGFVHVAVPRDDVMDVFDDHDCDEDEHLEC
jgi:hypothetical protein